MTVESAVSLRISGRVQRVGFRNWMVLRAARLGLRGWVRNRRDGSVEALLVGPAAAVEAAVEACRHGPPLAAVDAVVAEPVQPVPDVAGFTAQPTL